MTPLGASLAFVIISIIISLMRHVIFPQNLSSYAQSSISLDKMYTVTNKKYTTQKKNYGSLFESYFQFHADEKYEDSQKNINNTISLQDYNSYVLKKSIINDQHTIICNEDFLVTINQGIICKEVGWQVKSKQKQNNDGDFNIVDKDQQMQMDTQQSGYNDNKCQWRTHFSIYELPLLKQQTKQTISISGQIGLARYLTQNDKKKRLFCKKIRNRNQYVINFPMSHLKSQNNIGQFWSLNDLYITKINNQEIKKQDINIKQDKSRNDKKVQEKSKKTITINQTLEQSLKKQSKAQKITKQKLKHSQKIQSKSKSDKTFQLLHYKYKLQQKQHHPFIHYCDGFCTTYITRQQPWVIRYNCDDQWKIINILDSKIQNFIFSKLNSTSLIPPFERQNIVKPRYLFTFQGQIKQYKLNCQKDECSQIQIAQSDNYLTYVFDHVNNKYRVEKFIMQLTFTLESSADNNIVEKAQYKTQKDQSQEENMEFRPISRQNQQKKSNQKKSNSNSKNKNQIQNKNEPEKIQKQKSQQFRSSYDRLRSHSVLMSQINPKRKMYTDCQINGKVDTHYQRYFDKYYWLYEHKPVYSIERWGLLCVIVFDLDQHIRIVQIQDILYRREIKHEPFQDYYDWKSIKKWLNYQDSFQKQLKQRKQTLKQHYNQNMFYPNLSNITAISQKNQTVKDNYSESQESSLFTRIMNLQIFTSNQQQENQYYRYIDAEAEIDSSYNQEEEESQSQQEDSEYLKKRGKSGRSERSDKKKQSKKRITKNKIRAQKKTVKERKEIQKKLKSIKEKNEKKSKNTNFTPVQIKGNKIDSFYNRFNNIDRNISYPHISLTNRYKFPLPFLLSLTNNMIIVNSDPKKPLILFSSIKNYLFTYREKTVQDPESKVKSKSLQYRYLILGAPAHPASKMASSKIKTIQQVKDAFHDKGQNQKVKIQIKDQTNPDADNVMRSIYEVDNDILNQIKSIASIPVDQDHQQIQKFETYHLQDFKRYVVVVWGWGIQVYQVNWQKNLYWKYNNKQKKVQKQLKQSQSKWYLPISIFIPFVQLFATVYCMFQVLITSR